jgi:antitoxin component YwqK of YwqJK toxin-antitoxin module
MRYIQLLLVLTISLISGTKLKSQVIIPTDVFVLASQYNQEYFLKYDKKSDPRFTLYRKNLSSGKVEMTENNNVILEYKDDHLYSAKFVIDGITTGYEYVFHRKNKISRISFYNLSGAKTGPEYDVLVNGTVWLELNYENGRFHGAKKMYAYSRGRITGITQYKNGKLHGDDISYFRSGKISMKTPYVDDLEEGDRIVYNRRGKIKGCYQFSAGTFIQEKALGAGS